MKNKRWIYAFLIIMLLVYFSGCRPVLKEGTGVGGSNASSTEASNFEKSVNVEETTASSDGESSSTNAEKNITSSTGATEKISVPPTKEQLYTQGFEVDFEAYPIVDSGVINEYARFPTSIEEMAEYLHLGNGIIFKGKKKGLSRQFTEFSDDGILYSGYSETTVEVLDPIYGDICKGDEIVFFEDAIVVYQGDTPVTKTAMDIPFIKKDEIYIFFMKKSTTSTTSKGTVLYNILGSPGSLIEVDKTINDTTLSSFSKKEQLTSKEKMFYDVHDRYIVHRNSLNTAIDLVTELERYISIEKNAVTQKIKANDWQIDNNTTASLTTIKNENASLTKQLAAYETTLTKLETAKTQAEVLALVPDEVKGVFQRCIENYGTK